MKTIYLSLLALVAMLSCTSIKTDPAPDKVRTSIVTTRYSNEHIPNNATFQWAPGQVKFYTDKRLAKTKLDELIKTSIVTELSNKGYVFKPEASTTRFIVGYVAGLKSSLTDSKIVSDYGLNPGLSDHQLDASEQEKGTIIVSIINPENARVIWRGVGQAFATLIEIPQNVREERLQAFMRNMFSDLPMALE